ncbi:pol [Symbiodinium necroappetens]|uniref:Pol protein n=1 Tax=Symbiodinium necroappetens TaxID=1628268 RepID=A0A812N7Y5_9DINO|nr:pol [Symbiodinium necroappetens]
MGALEELTGARLGSAEGRIGAVETKVESLENKIEELSKRLEAGSGASGSEGERKLTLVYGGWPRDSRRADILQQLRRGLEGLQVWEMVDSEPFTTGPRRTTALSVFKARPGESHYDVRQRMHGIIRSLADNEILLPGEKKLFATFAKSRAERDIAGHAALVKRTIHGLAPQAAHKLDIEYASGGVWAGQSFVASARQPPPPGVAPGSLVWDENKGGKWWIHVAGLARELGLSEAAIKVSFPLYSWNAGGAAENNYAKTISDLVEGIPGDALIVIQEVARQEPGWQRQTHDAWQSLLFRDPDAWRGVGLIFKPAQWSVMRRKTTERGAWFRVRHVSGSELWVGAAHFTPGTSQAVHGAQVSAHLKGLPPTHLPVLLGCDVNARISWCVGDEGEGIPTAKNGKMFDFLAQCKGRGLDPVAPDEQDFETPTSCPRQEGRTGSQIDVVLGARALGTDHELLSAVVHIKAELRKLAQDAFSYAKATGEGAAWTRARKLRKQARLEWEQDRLDRATSGDWNAYRQLKKPKNEGWDVVFAEAHEGKEPHQVIHDHLAGIYGTGQVIPPLGAWDGPVDLFTLEELEQAISKGKRGKAVGVDGTSQEFLVGLAAVPGGKEALLRFFNKVYQEAAIPADWNTALMVVIPKELFPVEPKSLRPLAMSSSIAKCYCRLLLGRTACYLQHSGPSQCSREGRQTAEYVFTIARVMELEAEWKRGVVMAKIDLHKAYDMVDRPALLARLQRAMGDGPTFRSWHALLAETDAVLQTGWDCSRLQLDRGIKQGSIESPALFSYLAEQILEDTKVFPGLALEESLFMDDGCVWAPTSQALGRKLEEWSEVLLRAGLTLNPSKCKVYFSPYADKSKPVTVQGKPVPSLPAFTIMGVPFRVGANSAELLAPFVQRAKDKFWSIKHLLRARTPLKGRVQLLDRVVGNLVLWCLAALTPDAGGMQAMVYSMVGSLVDFRRLWMCLGQEGPDYKDSALAKAQLETYEARPCGAGTTFHEAKRDPRPGELPSQKVDEQTPLLEYVTTPLHGGNRQGKQTSESDRTEKTEGSMMEQQHGADEDEADEEMSSFMQSEHLQGLWHELLEEIRLKLEGYGKAERSQVAGHLIRLLAHRAVKSADGYLLGHMTGRTASLTALLVAMRDDECYGCKVPPGDEKIPWLRQAWDGITRYIPEHPGSRAAEGKWPDHDTPMIIRLFMHPVPMDTPPTSPIRIEDSLEAQGERAPKRACVRVELSSGSGDHPQMVALEVPIEGGRARLNLDVSIPETEDRASPASAIPAPWRPLSSGDPGTVGNLPVELPAPAGPEADFEQLQMGWQGGQITVEAVTSEHGPYVAEQLLLQWGPPGDETTNCGPVSTQHARPPVADTAPDQEEDDATGLLAMWWFLVVPGGSGAGVQQRTEDFFSVARRVVRYLQDHGTPEVVVASALMEQVWRRHEEDYTLQMEDYYDHMGLTIHVERDCATDLTADSEAVIEWLEAELWQEYIDELEGAIGECHQVQEARPGHTQLDDVTSFMEGGRAKPTPKHKANPAKGRGRDRRRDEDEGGEDRRPERGRGGPSDTSRRRVSRRRYPRRGMAGPRARSRTPVARTTTEVRRLLPRAGGRSPPMTIGDATCFWLHTLGLRDGLATDDHRALNPEEHENRVQAISEVRPEDLTVVMAALMRTMALFIVEASQLMMVRVQQARDSRQGEMVEVEVEEGDEEMWMQTSATAPGKRMHEDVEQMAEDEREVRRQKQAEATMLEQQLEARAREEEDQARQDEMLFLRHQGARYRDWEQWEVLNCGPSKPRRLQASLSLVHGESAEQITCSVPLARGRAIDLRIQLHERGGDESGVAPTQVEDTARGPVLSEAEYMHMYREWMQGRVSEEALEQMVGAEMVAMFQAQRLVEGSSQPGGEGVQEADQLIQHGAECEDALVSEEMGVRGSEQDAESKGFMDAASAEAK